MTKFVEKRKVIELRRRGKSYSEIKKIVKISKSSLSLWLRNIPLTEKQILRIKGKKEQTIERFRETMSRKRARRTSGYYVDQSKKWLPLSDRELYLAGLFLYLGEGGKTSRNTVNICNTDPSVMKFVLFWMLNSLKVPKNEIRLNLHLYSDMDIEKESNYWLKQLGLTKKHLNKPYIKKSRKTDLDQKGFGHGTCSLCVHNTVLKENILMSLRAITDNYSVNPVRFDIIT